ncbi:divergent PAP2 family protein [Tepidibacillus infernus]|uniref:Acid phosphatase n=1 Tax=Tepidibacillus decaturensis TaxID=1413211 RepID=A0A135L2M8_9BACI|nr:MULTISPECIES: divergent PAP2 family protein [Tepidibacillus]KXG43200.1 hypothetical protein U473_03590 [Tepidibacillus decaturensis]GBF10165.1 divergent PAP2 family protein [Tepidibacillus sp. HK-1]
MILTALIHNYPLITAFVSMLIAQIIKFPLLYIMEKKLEPMIMFSNGGMPSSHSAFVTSLTTALGIKYGVESPYFAIATVFALITMWDAAGVRYQASEHARILNILVQDFQNLVEHVKYKTKRTRNQVPLKELLGHKPFEVLVGSFLGFLIAFIIKYWVYQ